MRGFMHELEGQLRRMGVAPSNTLIVVNEHIVSTGHFRGSIYEEEAAFVSLDTEKAAPFSDIHLLECIELGLHLLFYSDPEDDICLYYLRIQELYVNITGEESLEPDVFNSIIKKRRIDLELPQAEPCSYLELRRQYNSRRASLRAA